jgi:hypothetical protein
MILKLAALVGSLCACCAVAACGASTTTSSPPGPTPTPIPTASAVATPTPSPTPAATPTPIPVPVVGTGAASPVVAVEDVAKVDPGSGQHLSGDCNSSSYLVPPCPVTQRFGARLDANPFSGSGGGADPLCRCQSLITPTFALISESGTTAYVHEDLGLGDPSTDLRWTVVSVGGTWYVDDQDTGCSATTIYNPAYDHFNAGGTPAPAAPTC